MSADRDGGEGFASRWSRRKRAHEHRAQEDQGADPAAREPGEEMPPTPEAAGSMPGTGEASEDSEDPRTDEEILAELGLPDPDSLDPQDDFSAFMREVVPARIRNRALRRLWLSNPVLANLDELLEYGEDFTAATTAVENLQTAYRVGRGMVDRAAGAGEGAAADAPRAPDRTSGTLPVAEKDVSVAPQTVNEGTVNEEAVHEEAAYEGIELSDLPAGEGAGSEEAGEHPVEMSVRRAPGSASPPSRPRRPRIRFRLRDG